MYINEAVKEALANDGCVSRKSWGDGFMCKIIPTNSPDCCVVINFCGARSDIRWAPMACDLIADDWIVIP